VRAAYPVMPEDSYKRVGLTIPLWQADLLRAAEEISEGCDIDDTGMYTILDWEKMLGALMKLQAMCKPLADGQVCVRIKGWAGEEMLCVSVHEGVPAVTVVPETAGGKSAAPTAREFTHLQALRYFLAPYTILRNDDALAQCWFPLPLRLMGIDTV